MLAELEQDEVVLSARDLLALQAFELAARTGSFKAAAEALHITASAVSHRIAGLERTLGARLFERGPRGVVLAPAGIAINVAAPALIWWLSDVVCGSTRAVKKRAVASLAS